MKERLTYLATHPKMVATWLLTALVGLNMAFGWLPESAVNSLLALAAVAGVTVLHVKHDDAQSSR